MSITLYTDSNASQTFTKSNDNLEGNFKRAVVETGTWIFYTYANFNNAQYGAASDNYKVLKDGDEGSIESVNGSMQLVENATEGFVLFEHIYYGGTMKVRVAKVKPRLNRKTSPRYATSADVCFRVTCTAC